MACEKVASQASIERFKVILLAPRVLIIRYEGTPFAIRMSKVIRNILDCGWEVDVLIPENGLGKVNVSKEMGRDLSEEVQIIEFPINNNKLFKQWQRILTVFPITDSLFEQFLVNLVQKNSYSLIIVKDSHVLNHVFSALSKTYMDQVPVACDMYENASEQLYDHLVRFGSWKRKFLTTLKFTIPRVRQRERKYLPKCAHIFVVVEEAREYLLNNYSIIPARVSVVHNVEVLADFDLIKEPIVIPNNFNEILITYVGSLGPHRGIKLLIEAVKIISKVDHPPFHVHIVGAEKKQLEELTVLCNQKGIQDLVQIEGIVPHRAAMQWVKKTNIGVIPHFDTTFIRTTIPNKLFQLMAAGSMCIVSDVGPLARIVNESGCGLTFEAGSSKSLASTLLKAINNPSLISDFGAKGRAAVEARYRWEIEGQLYNKYLQHITSSK
jgi:glycosyltransferase involved in cell wall biosynthesis